MAAARRAAEWAALEELLGLVAGQAGTLDERCEAFADPDLLRAAEIPDNHHFSGRAGIALPLWRDAAGTEPNVAPGLIGYLEERLEGRVAPEDLFAYVAAVMAHPGYTTRFTEDLIQPGPRVPLTADAALWERAVEMGRRVLWLHTFAERYADPAAGRPPERVPQGAARLLEAISARDGELPEEPLWEEGALVLGAGRIAPVGEEIWRYEVSTMRVPKHWLEYRMRAPAARGSGTLDQVVADAWPHPWTEELLELIWVLERLVALELGQDALLREITTGPTISCIELAQARVLPVDKRARKAPAGARLSRRPAGHDEGSLLDGRVP